jgi:hypothetical protein
MLAAGQMSVCKPEIVQIRLTFEASRLIWSFRQARPLSCAAEAGARGMVMLVSQQTLVRALPASLLADQMEIVLSQGLSIALGQNDDYAPCWRALRRKSSSVDRGAARPSSIISG